MHALTVELIRTALFTHAAQLRTEAKSRKLAGPRNKDTREHLRRQAQAAAQQGRVLAGQQIYTREEVSQAMNAGADLFTDLSILSSQDASLIDLVVNAGLTLLDNPGTSLDNIIRDNYETEDPDEDPIAMVRGWIAGT